MELKNKLFAILAILCVLCSACAVSAADDLVSEDSGDFLDDSHDGHDGAIIPPDYTHDEARHAAGADPYLDGSQDGHNGTITPPDVAHNKAAMNNTSGNTTNATHATGEYVAGNSTNATAHNNNKLPATGNPILALLAVCGVLGGYTIIRRK